MKTFRKGGIHPPQCKLTAASPVIDLPLPAEVTLTFSQHIGAAGECVVAKGDRVSRGEIVVRATGAVSAHVHTPISGMVTRVERSKSAYGYPADTVTIVAGEDDRRADMEAIAGRRPVRDIDSPDADGLRRIVADAGIVGLGGATFPTRVKLSPPPGMSADILIVNGAECEPYLTCDHALMLSRPDEIIGGVRLAMRAASVGRAVIAVEANKTDAIERLRAAATAAEGIEVMPLKVKYPQGGEKQLINAVTGREVPSGALPVAVGAIVQNVATVHAIYNAVCYGTPLIDRIVTVTGPSVSRPGNYRAAIGTPIRTLIEAAGGIPADTGKVILGGPMMGKAVVTVDAPTVKGVSGILLLPASEALRRRTEPCIRCGACIEACPMGLEPLMIATYARLNRHDDAALAGIMDCIECGSCSFVCPASRPLLDYIRVGKGVVGPMLRARKATP